MNKIWTILDGLRDTPVFGDYRRLTELSGLHINETTKESINTVFNISDPHIRGFIIEAVIQAALLSNYRDTLLDYDSLNTYDIPIAVRRNDEISSENNKATFVFFNEENLNYNSEGFLEKYGNSIMLTVNGKTTYIEPSTLIRVTRNTALSFPSISDISNTSFTVYSLPKDPPLTIFFRSLQKSFPDLTANTDVITASGKFIYNIINK